MLVIVNAWDSGGTVIIPHSVLPVLSAGIGLGVIGLADSDIPLISLLCLVAAVEILHDSKTGPNFACSLIRFRPFSPPMFGNVH